jgi:anti-sigma regulatory factor (Ser/Thr protein kinase)
MTRQITLQLEPSARAPRVSRSRLKELQDALEPKYSDVAIVVSELVTNSVKHGNGTEEIFIEVTAEGDTISVVVTDEGPCFTKEASRNGGMGLVIVDQIADRWEIRRNDGCQVRVEISRSA